MSTLIVRLTIGVLSAVIVGRAPGRWPVPAGWAATPDVQAWSTALRQTGRPIAQVFDKRQQNGTWDIGIFNTDTSASHTFSVPLAQLGLTGSASITDLWSGASDGTFTTTVAPGGVTLISAIPASGTGGTGELVSGQTGDCLDTTGNASPGPTSSSPVPGRRSGPATAAPTRNGRGPTAEVAPHSPAPAR